MVLKLSRLLWELKNSLDRNPLARFFWRVRDINSFGRFVVFDVRVFVLGFSITRALFIETAAAAEMHAIHRALALCTSIVSEQTSILWGLLDEPHY